MTLPTHPIRDTVDPVLTWRPGSTPTIRYIDIGSIDRVRRRVTFPSETDAESAPSRAKYILEADDILVSLVRPNLNAVASVTTELRGAIGSSGFAVLRPRKGVLDSRYLFHWVCTENFVQEMVRLSTGATYPAVTSDQVLSSELPLPPLAEQRRIAAILDKADALRRKRQEAIALTEQLLRSTFLEMFGDPVTNPKRWPTRPLGELITDGPTNGLYRPASDYGSGTPIIRIDAIQKGQVQEIDTLKRLRIPDELIAKFSLTEGDLLVNRVNSPDLLGKIALISGLAEATVYESNMMRFRVNQTTILPEYLTTLWQTPFLSTQIARRRKDASNQSSINQGDVQSFEVHIPPIDLQRAFRSVVRRLSHHERLSSAALTDADTLFNALTHRAFTGQL